MTEKTVRELERELSIAKKKERMSNTTKEHVNRDYGVIGPQAVKKERPESGDTPDYIALPSRKKGRAI
tara:strand:+ start:418 stop:621 length:204 start_codon:yes stop_codon:yes gene_type:complete